MEKLRTDTQVIITLSFVEGRWKPYQVFAAVASDVVFFTQFSEEMGADGSLRRSGNSMDLPSSAPRRPRKDRANPVDRDSVLSTGEAVVVRHHQKKSRSRQQNTGAYRFTVRFLVT